MIRHAVCVIAAVSIIGCANRHLSVEPMESAKQVDVARYTGEWHEVARLPAPFQRNNETAIAEYGLNTDGTLSVRNIAVRADGRKREIKGSATILNPPANSKLDVRFDTWFAPFIPKSPEGNYWILHTDPEYREAIVGTPSRKYLWILARDREISAERRERLVKIAKDRGFEVDRLIHHTGAD